MKWTIEWAMKRYGVKNIDPLNAISKYGLGEKIIFIGTLTHKWTRGNYSHGQISHDVEDVFTDERDAVKWLVADQPRVEKKRKWVLVSEGINDSTEHVIPLFGIKYELIGKKNGTHKYKVFKRSTPDEKAEK